MQSSVEWSLNYIGEGSFCVLPGSSMRSAKASLLEVIYMSRESLAIVEKFTFAKAVRSDLICYAIQNAQ